MQQLFEEKVEGDIRAETFRGFALTNHELCKEKPK